MCRKGSRRSYRKLTALRKWSTKLGVDFAALRQRRNSISGAEGQRLDGHGGLAAAGSHQAAAIAKKEVLYIMRPLVRINHRRPRIVPHSSGVKQMHAKLLFPSRITPFFLSARCLVDLSCPLNQPVGKL